MVPDPAKEGQHDTEEIAVGVHYAADKAEFDESPDSTLATVKNRALGLMAVPQDPNITYFLKYNGTRQENEAMTLKTLLGGKGENRRLTFQLEKVFGGGGDRGGTHSQ